MARKAQLPEMKTCPFCGCKATLLEYESPNPVVAFIDRRYNDPEYFVRCGSSRCKVQPETGVYETERAAINAWNKRKD